MLHSFTDLLTYLNMPLATYHSPWEFRFDLADCLRSGPYFHGYRCLHLDINGKQCASINSGHKRDATHRGVSTILTASLDLEICSIDLQSELAKGLRRVYCSKHAGREHDPETFTRAVEMERVITNELQIAQQALKEVQQQTANAEQRASNATQQAEKLTQAAEKATQQTEASDLEAAILRDVVDDGRVYVTRARELASQQQEEWRDLFEQTGDSFGARDEGSQAGGEEESWKNNGAVT
ncbi:hypothetical protein EJ03DRAFT_350433 [Teratosphaeria nubilosa]|uniref:Uncharacterized protein n=1 Tax=Teratosphaeria nubilosa TaxID=161662 RepID=A0A6G1LCP9_9PEZI|nr:hypothetical protein EJ03DRAFT_350433 [Teratosphaeria nubilosa]